jgi:hypothetical protein
MLLAHNSHPFGYHEVKMLCYYPIDFGKLVIFQTIFFLKPDFGVVGVIEPEIVLHVKSIKKTAVKTAVITIKIKHGEGGWNRNGYQCINNDTNLLLLPQQHSGYPDPTGLR